MEPVTVCAAPQNVTLGSGESVNTFLIVFLDTVFSLTIVLYPARQSIATGIVGNQKSHGKK
jgi:hypothetical protein